MTQALLNNLNISKDESFNLSDKNSKAVISDFEKILDSKTNSGYSEQNNNISNTDSQKNENIKDTQKDEEICNINEQKVQTLKNSDKDEQTTSKTLGDVKQKLMQENLKNQILDELTKNQKSQEIISEEIENLILEEVAEITVATETTETTDDTVDADNSEAVDNSESDETDAEQQNLDENITQETNITEEDSTMYKEMSAPENPTTVLLLSQIQTTVKLPVPENTEVTEKETTVQRTKDNTLDVQINKQFDELLPKEVPTIGNGTKSTSNSNTEQPKQSTVLSEKIVKELNIESLNSEMAQNSASGDLMQNQSPQEQTVKIMIQGEIKSDVNIQLVKTAEVKPTEITPSKIIEQISKQLESMYNNSKLEMVLNPGTLGKLHLHLMNTKDGLVAQFTVTTQEARDLLMKGLNGLKDALLAQGVSVDTVSVKLEESDNDTGFDWDDKEGSQGGNKQQGTRKQKEEKKPFEQMMFEIENDDNLV